MARKGRKKDDNASEGLGGRTRAAIFLVIALVAGLSSTVVIYNLIQGYQAAIAEARKPADTVKVVIASRDLYQGITITEDDLVQISIEPQFLPGGDEKLVYTSAEHIIGRVPRERILANEFIREERLADPETGTGLNAIIPRGMRALSVNIADGQALSGFLNPGDYVDVVVTITGDDRDARKVGSLTNTLVQAVYVLAVNDRTGKDLSSDSGDPRKKKKKVKMRPSVTVAVTPEQAEQIAYAERKGEITLTLRNVQDLQFIESTGANKNAVLGIEEPEPEPEPKKVYRPKPKPKEPEGQMLTIVRGSETTQETVSNKE